MPGVDNNSTGVPDPTPFSAKVWSQLCTLEFPQSPSRTNGHGKVLPGVSALLRHMVSFLNQSLHPQCCKEKLLGKLISV